MLPLLSQDLMRAYHRHGVDGRPLDRNAAHLLDLRNARREAKCEARLEAQRARQDPPQRPRRGFGWPLWLALLLPRRPA